MAEHPTGYGHTHLDYPYDPQGQGPEAQFAENKGPQDGPDNPIHKLFVGQIPPFTSEDTLRATFSSFGPITDVVILKDRHTGAHKGCGFVCYASRQSADLAISALADKVKLPNAKREMIVRYAGERPDEKEYKLYVCMLSRQSTEAEVRALFEPYGTLTEVFIIRSREGNQSKGAAFVKFTNKEDAQRAVEAIHDKVKDKDAPGLVQVRFAHTKEERAAHLAHVLGAHAGHPHPAAAAAMHAAMMRGIPAAHHINPAYAHQLTGYPSNPHHPHHHSSHPAAYPHPMSLNQGKYTQNGGYPLYAQPSYGSAARGSGAMPTPLCRAGLLEQRMGNNLNPLNPNNNMVVVAMPTTPIPMVMEAIPLLLSMGVLRTLEVLKVPIYLFITSLSIIKRTTSNNFSLTSAQSSPPAFRGI